MILRSFFCGLIFSLTFHSLQATGSDILPIARITEAVEFSGNTAPNIWDMASPVNLQMHVPNFGKSPGEQTEVRIGYDDKYLWVFARLHYTDPTQIVSKSKKRDEESRNSDSFGIILDTYDDNESGLAFFTTPAGQRIDFAISNDGNFQPSPQGNTSLNFSWNTFWDVKTAPLADGWSVEMRIPFSSLRFQEKDGKVRMGLIMNRSVSYCNEIDTYPEIDPKHGPFAPLKPSLAQTIEMDGLKPAKPVYIAPYILTGIEHNQLLNEARTNYSLERKPQLTGGLDIKYSLNSNLTLDLTANTDFAQVEADDEYVNITRFSMFLPEKRMFFQERSSIFGFNMGRFQELFYSRRIGLNDGNPVRIYGGARLTGRIGKWDIGMLDMQTADYKDTPSENFGVLRARRQVFNHNSYIGGMATTRIGMNGASSMAYGADGVFRLFGDDYLETRFAQTTNPDGKIKVDAKANSFAYLKWERRNQEGFAYNLTYSYSGMDFNPSAGFMAKLGIAGIDTRAQYGWLPGEKSKLLSFKLIAGYMNIHRLVDNGLENRWLNGGIDLKTKNGWSVMAFLFHIKEGILNEFKLSDNVFVPTGEYVYKNIFSIISTPLTKPLVLRFILNGGEFYDGTVASVTTEPTLNLSSSLQVTGSYGYNRISFDSRDQLFSSHIARLKVLYMYNTKLSVSSFVQYNSVNRMMIGNFRLRYNPKEGNDFFLVYNESRPTSNYLFGSAPGVPFLNRMILLKYVYTFTF
ncbi:MAG: DUF5916 domain-containing protein [Bacteroidota bacterium]|nr:hypothetical protein [Odoribacter sp.]MDP3643443.1 DUF5916 domain-containing protein [Bacteroidota bacterium]